MRRRSIERLAALIDDPGPPGQAEDRDLVTLAGISRQLSAAPQVEPDQRFVANLRVVLMAAAAQPAPSGCGERSTLESFRSRIHLWIVVVAVGVLAVAGVSFAGDSADRQGASPTYGPVAPTSAPATRSAPKGGTGKPSQPAPAVPGSGGRSAAPGSPAGGSAAPAATAPSAPATSPLPSRDPLVCVKLLNLPELCI